MMMKAFFTTALGLLLCSASVFGQGARPSDLGASPLPIGDPGVMWYTTWETGLEEAKRSNRPIFFMAAAATCSGISGVFWPGYTDTQNSLFSRKDFIEISRKFVCCRIESYESKEAQDMVRSYLNGSFANTAFCILNPTGEERLSRSGRGPAQSMLGRGKRGEEGDKEIVAKLKEIAGKYEKKGSDEATLLQDFHSFRQALNVASGDQRLLLYVDAEESELATIRTTLQPVMVDDQVIGRFHLDLGNSASDAKWQEVITDEQPEKGYLIIHSDEFGMKGTALKQLPLTASALEIKTALLNANQKFAEMEERKVYSEHVSEGRREGINFETPMPYGEDRDGDGEIDKRGKGKGKGKGGKGKGKGKGGKGKGGKGEEPE